MEDTRIGKILAIVPARGGSKGILRKNMRGLAGRPLIMHTLELLAAIDEIDRLVVSTEDAEIASFAATRGFEVVERDPSLAGDEATLSQVAMDVARRLQWDGVVGVFQPTSPLRSAESVREAIESFRSSDVTSLASAVRERHLYWMDDGDDPTSAEPLFTERRNRQFATHRVLRETGSIQLVTVDALMATGDLVTDRHRLFETPSAESVDIDTLDDFDAVRRRLERGTVILRVRANRHIGTGHLYHSLALADELQDHRVEFLLKDCDGVVEERLRERGWAFTVETDLGTALDAILDGSPTVLVNDILDTAPADVAPAVARDCKVVNVEDLGEGARFADWVVNALYPPNDGVPHAATGPDYTTLRTEFLALPHKEYRATPRRVLVTFGGSDPARLTGRVARALSKARTEEIRVIVGPVAKVDDIPEGVTVLTDINSMASEMLEADLIVTSAGRTVYEAAATGTPVVVIAQNARESTHAHLSLESGVIFLGLGPLVDDEHVVEVVDRLLDDPTLREELGEKLRSTVDGLGTRRIARRIRGMIEGLE